MTTTAPTVSVIIPAFNAAGTIAETVRSALGQTFKHTEIIVIDDGSTDPTASIVAAIAADAPNLKLLSVENAGQSRARNLALSLARGKYIAPLDADDIWHPTYLEKLVAALEQAGPRASMAYALVRRIDQRGFVTETKIPRKVSQTAFHQMLAFNVVGTGSGIVMSRQAALESGGYETRIRGAEDYLMQVRLARRGLVIAVCEYLVGYRTTPRSLSTRNYAMSRASQNLMAIVEDEFKDADKGVLAQAKARVNADAFVHALKARKYKEAVGDIVTALVNSPTETVWTLLRKAGSANRRANPSAPGAHSAAPDLATLPQFLELDPVNIPKSPSSDHVARRLDAARRIDAAFGLFEPTVADNTFKSPSTACHN